MRRHAAAIAGLLLLLPSVGMTAEAPPVNEEIGSWVLNCPGGATSGACQLRYRNWVLPPGGGRPSAALEVQRRGDALVPVVTLRGLSAQAAIGGLLTMKATVGVRFDGGPRTDLACGLAGDAIVCAPEGAAVAQTAAQLPAAHVAMVQIQLNLPGVMALPAQDRTMDLQATPQALARFRAVGPAGEALPAEAGLDWRGFLDRVLRGAGFENGAADLLPRLTGWFGAGRG